MTGMRVYFKSEPMKIGKHWWRLIVRDSSWCSGHCIEYEYSQDVPEGFYWHPGRYWPSFDINDGMHLGLPKSLRRLYMKHKETIAEKLSER